MRTNRVVYTTAPGFPIKKRRQLNQPIVAGFRYVSQSRSPNGKITTPTGTGDQVKLHYTALSSMKGFDAQLTLKGKTLVDGTDAHVLQGASAR